MSSQFFLIYLYDKGREIIEGNVCKTRKKKIKN